jgi:Asp-tRNA(Asn)/Glu-tRNA(Gln) amidotransferase A subunit family amidase
MTARWRLRESMRSETDKDSEGLPIGVQVAALPGREEDILNVMALLEKQYKENDKSLAGYQGG